MKIKFLIFLLILGSCDMFKTREPEQPSNDNVVFLPPTEPQILIENFQNAVENLNSENYVKCLSNEINKQYIFIPSQSLNASLFNIFANWTISDERRFMNILNSISSSENKPILNWINPKPIIENQDSAVYESDYSLKLNFIDKNLSEIYSGSIRFVMITDKQEFWYISKWYDFSNISDTNNNWSFLKAKLYN